MNNLFCFIDHEFKHFTVREIPKELYELGICEKQGQKVRFKVVGIIIAENLVFSILPKGSQVTESLPEMIQKTRIVIKTLLKYNRSSYDGDIFNSGITTNIEPLQTIYWLIQDYLQYGIVQFQNHKKEINGRGKINWPKTIKETTPYIVNSRPYYLDLITHRTDSAYQNEVSLIHEYVIHKISEMYGWLFQFKADFQPARFSFKLSQMIYIIKRAIRETYVDREIELFKRLLQYLENKTDNEINNLSFYATPSFNVVWEKICGEIFNNDQEIHELMPNPYWSVNNRIFRTSQRADILFKENEKHFVLDAKYYSVNRGLDKLPGWGDIVKQLYYSRSIQNAVEDCTKIYNAFIFPASVQEYFEYHGFASVEGMEDELLFGKVLSYVLDVEFAMKQYISRIDLDIRSSLIEDIINR
jgi:hypothetical protein